MFLLVPAYPGCPGSKAIKRSLLLYFIPISKILSLEYSAAWSVPGCPAMVHIISFISVCGELC